MKKLINSPDTVLAEALDGLVAAHPHILALGPERKFVQRRFVPKGKVALLSGGGSGHEPMQVGFVGHGMLDAACPGEVFTAPTPDRMVAAVGAVDTGAGVLMIVTNYDGDVMNFEMAAELCEGVPIARVLTNDDVAVQDSLYTTGRRGVAGTLVVEKIVGAAAEQGLDLAGCKALGDRIMAGTRSMGIALTSCTVPAAGKPTFDIGPGDMEFGVGIHGEPGRRRGPVQPAQALADEMLAAITADFGTDRGPVLLFVNGFGGTPLMELYAMYDNARRLAEQHGFTIARTLVGNYVTSLDMAGCSITLARLDDAAVRLWDAPVHTAALRWGM
jgi:phosphoenolpyruvate---glycerone phosphotransferase subunit DhaK